MASVAAQERRRGAGRTRVGVGRRLAGRYRLERQIGRGGSAEVWEARDERLGRTVAIKTLHPHLLPDAPSRARFAAEARAAAGLSHPSIVPVYDVIEDVNSPAIVFRYVAGTTLADRLASNGPLSEREAVAIGADLAGALAHAHRLGIVHRDVKPGNVLIEDDDGRALLVDFGIAHLLADAANGETTAGHVMGTLRYMAPEQLGGGSVDGRTDLFALGLVLHEMLAGSPAFDAASPADLVDAQRRGPPQPPSRAGADLRALLEALLAPDPSNRPADAAEVEARLRAIGAVLEARGVTPPDAAAPPTLMPGLPAASAGLALAAGTQPPAAQPAEAGAPLDASIGQPPTAERDTIALPAMPTVAIAVPVVESAPAAGPLGTRAAATPNPAPRPATLPGPTATSRGATSRPRVPARAVLLGAGGLGIGALVLAALAAGSGIGHPGVVAGAGTPSPHAQPTASAPPPSSVRVVVPSPKPHPKHRGHGHGADG